MRVRGAAVAACAALLVAACSGNGDAGGEAVDETAVLGVVTERTASPTPEPTVTTPPVATARPTSRATVTPAPTSPAERTAEPERTTEPARTPVATLPPAPAPVPEPVPPAPTRPDPAPPSPGPVVLASGSGWSTNTLLPDADGEGWTEVGGPPPVGEDGTAAERLLARLVHEGTTGDAAGRQARCSAWIEALPGTPLRVDGEAVVELLVGEDVAARSIHRLETTVGAGQRLDLPRWERAVRLHAAEGQAVTCTAWFSGAG